MRPGHLVRTKTEITRRHAAKEDASGRLGQRLNAVNTAAKGTQDVAADDRLDAGIRRLACIVTEIKEITGRASTT